MSRETKINTYCRRQHTTLNPVVCLNLHCVVMIKVHTKKIDSDVGSLDCLCLKGHLYGLIYGESATWNSLAKMCKTNKFISRHWLSTTKPKLSSCWTVCFISSLIWNTFSSLASVLPSAHTRTHTQHSNLSNLMMFWEILYLCLSFAVSLCITFHLHDFTSVFGDVLYTYSYFPLSLSLSLHLVVAPSNPLNRCVDPSLSNAHLSFFSFLSFHRSPSSCFCYVLIGFLSLSVS